MNLKQSIEMSFSNKEKVISKDELDEMKQDFIKESLNFKSREEFDMHMK